MNRTIPAMLLSAAFLIFTLTTTTQAQPKGVKQVNPNPIYSLNITSITPNQPVLEHSQIEVAYTLSVKKSLSKDYSPQGGAVCPANATGECKNYNGLALGQIYRGVIRMKAPAAGADAPVELHYCLRGTGETYGCNIATGDEKTIRVFARYEVAIDFFEILHTRAHRYDTVYISLQGKVKGQRSSQEDACAIQGPPTFCLPGMPQGDHDDGVHPVSNVRIGPFDLVPEVDEDLHFSYAAVNFGTSYNQRVFKKIMDGISDATSFGLSVYQPQSSGAWNQGNDFTHKLNELQWGGCDGPVGNDVATALNRTISNQYQSTLDARTKDSGVWRQTSPIYEITSQDGCGKSSKYKIGWAIYRTSWQR